MSLSYEPKEEQDFDLADILPDGTYDFEVIETDDSPSKKGNEMLTLKLRIFDGEGGDRNIFDYIAYHTNFGGRKLRHAAAACNLLDGYKSGSLDHFDFRGKTGRVDVRTRKAEGEFPAKNIIIEYLPRTDDRPTKEIVNDDIPF